MGGHPVAVAELAAARVEGHSRQLRVDLKLILDQFWANFGLIWGNFEPIFGPVLGPAIVGTIGRGNCGASAGQPRTWLGPVRTHGWATVCPVECFGSFWANFGLILNILD